SLLLDYTALYVLPLLFLQPYADHRYLHSFPTRRSSDLNSCPYSVSKTIETLAFSSTSLTNTDSSGKLIITFASSIPSTLVIISANSVCIASSFIILNSLSVTPQDVFSLKNE